MKLDELANMNGLIGYVTDEKGEQIGVLMELSAYQALVSGSLGDPELLSGLSVDELEALAEGKLATGEQARLDELLARHAEEGLADEETEELDGLLAQVDQLTILKTRARYTLQQLTTSTSAR